jgi:hypothetical protein
MALAAVALAGCSHPKEAAGTGDVVGPMLRAQLPPAFVAVYDTVHVQTEFIDLIRKAGVDVEIRVFLGTWCSDSRLHVPRFLKVVDLVQPSLAHVSLYGLDRKKKSPQGDEAAFGIVAVPTFIFLRHGKEIGRIVETPQTSMEADMLTLLASGVPQ